MPLRQSLWGTGELCLYGTVASCQVVSIGYAVCTPVCAVTSAGFVWPLRLAPGSERVPLAKVWSRLTPQLGRWPAAAFIGPSS